MRLTTPFQSARRRRKGAVLLDQRERVLHCRHLAAAARRTPTGAHPRRRGCAGRARRPSSPEAVLWSFGSPSFLSRFNESRRLPSKVIARSRKPRFHRSDGASHHLRDLIHGQALQVMQRHHHPVVRRERGDGLPYPLLHVPGLGDHARIAAAVGDVPLAASFIVIGNRLIERFRPDARAVVDEVTAGD